MSEILSDAEREEIHSRLRAAEVQARGAAIEVSNCLGILQRDYYARARAKRPWYAKLRDWRNRRLARKDAERWARIPMTDDMRRELDAVP